MPAPVLVVYDDYTRRIGCGYIGWPQRSHSTRKNHKGKAFERLIQGLCARREGIGSVSAPVALWKRVGESRVRGSLLQGVGNRLVDVVGLMGIADQRLDLRA